jgi:hypothetical protein
MTRTSLESYRPPPPRRAGRKAIPAAPGWVAPLLGSTVVRRLLQVGDRAFIEITRGADFALISSRATGARSLPADEFREISADAYRHIAQALRDLEPSGLAHPVRFWNHIPGILEPIDRMQNRYMAFNAGRFAAFATWYGDIEAFDARLATASGTGWDGQDLLIHCLVTRDAGRPVANPRQIPPHRYSRRYGPLPPCFARATLLRQPRRLLVGGTASVVGEDSLHAHSLIAQFEESLVNLGAIVAACTRDAPATALRRFTDLRVYHPHAPDRQVLSALCEARFPAARQIEFVQADLCRQELLVEIEGLATMEGF